MTTIDMENPLAPGTSLTHSFANVAEAYRHRFSHNADLLATIHRTIGEGLDVVVAADIGAGIGTSTRVLSELGCKGFAVEPNSAMRIVGQRQGEIEGFEWVDGTFAATGLPDASVNWVTAFDAFHYGEREATLREIHRILKPGGHFTMVWGFRDHERDELQRALDEFVRRQVPGVRRVYEDVLDLVESFPAPVCDSGLFRPALANKGWHVQRTSREGYMAMWAMCHDIQRQTSPTGWVELLDRIEARLPNQAFFDLKFETLSWTIQRIDPT